MKAKHTLLFLAVTALVLSLAGCSKSFLEVYPDSDYTGDSYYTSDEAVLKAIQPLYNRAWWGYNYRSALGIGSYRANDAWNPYNAPEFTRFQTTALTDEVLRAWSSLYTVVTMSNALIRDVTQKCGEDVSEDVKNLAIGTAYTMRAASYFYMVRIWGPVILIEDNDAAVNNPHLPLNPTEDVFKFIIRDLYKAIEYLPEKAADGYTGKYAAEGLLAKVLLARSGWKGGSRNAEDLAECIRLCEDVIDKGPYSLMEDYEDLFKYQHNNNKETMLAMEWADPLVGGWWEVNSTYSDLASTNYTDDVMVWGGITASVDMIQLYNINKDKDKRWKGNFFTPGDFYDYMWTDTGGFTFENDWMQVKKGVVGRKCDVDGHLAMMASPLNTYILRYADVLLTHAEACLGNSDKLTSGRGLDSYNALLERAGLPAVSSVTFEDIIVNRRIEFCMEYCNWYDMVSWYMWKPDYMLDYFNNKQYRGITIHDGGVQKLDDGMLIYLPVNYTDADGNEIWSDNPAFSLTDYMTNYSDYVPVKVTPVNIFIPYPETDVLQNPKLSEDPVPYDFGE